MPPDFLSLAIEHVVNNSYLTLTSKGRKARSNPIRSEKVSILSLRTFFRATYHLLRGFGQVYVRRHFLTPPQKVDVYNKRVMDLVCCEAQVEVILV